MKNLTKKLLTFAISIAMIATTIPVTAVSAAESIDEEAIQAVETAEYYEEDGVETASDESEEEVTIENVEIELNDVVAYTLGYYEAFYDESSDGYVDYYYYDPWNLRGTFTYTLSNGEEYTSDRCYMETDEYWFELSYMTNQGSEEQWEPGGEYVVTYSYGGKEFPATVRIADSPVESMTFETKDVTKGTGGYLYSYRDDETDEIVEYYRYYASSFIDSWTITMKDGEIIEGNETYFYYNDVEYEIELLTDQDASNPWGEGSHEISVSIMGYKTTLDVNITESMIESLEVETADVVKNTGGDYTWDYDYETDEEVEYYYYDVDSFVSKYIITMKNGDVIETDSRWYEYDGQEYSIQISCDQSANNQWGVGSHKAKASTMGLTTEFTANIVENPIKNITFETKEVPYMTGGYWDWDWDEESGDEIKYFRYSYTSFIDSWTITMKDGSVIKGKGDEFSYKGKDYYIDFYGDQSPSNQWDKGQHEITASVMGYETTFDVVVGDSAVASIEVETIDVIENTGGEYSWGTNENDEEIRFYNYDNWSFVSKFIITMKNGDVIEADRSWFDYDNYEYQIQLSSDQSADNPWGVGTHKITATVMGETVDFDANIAESPVEEIFVKTKDVVEGTCGYLDEDWEEEYITAHRYYDGAFIDSMTIVLKNGEEIDVDYATEYAETEGEVYVKYNDEWHRITVTSDQSVYDPWGVGEHEITVSVLGGEVTVPVTVTESPVADIEFKTSDIQAYTHGQYRSSWDGDDDFEGAWYKYDDFYDSYIVKMENGDTVKGTKNTFTYDGSKYEITLDTEQSYYNQWDPGKHSVQVTVAGYETSFDVNIVESPYESVEVIGVEELEKNRWDEYDYPELTLKVTESDGSTFMEYLNAKDQYGESTGNPEHVYMTWKDIEGVGSDNILFMSYAGIEVDVPVTIVEVSDFDYVEHEDGIFITGYKGGKDCVELPESIGGKTVVGVAFEGYHGISELIIPDSVKYISDFESDYSLEKVTIGAGVTGITGDTFKECRYLKEIIVSTDNPNYTSIDGVVYDKAVTTLIAFPPAKTGEYRVPATVTNLDILNDYVTEEITVIFEGADGKFVTVDGVTYNADMTEVIYCDKEKAGAYVMPESVTDIASGAFRNCTKLTDVTVSKKVTAITYEDFANCTSLANVSMPETVKSIDAGAFRKCTKLASVDIPEKTTTIDYMAFSNSGLKNAGTLDSVETIGAKAFAYTPLESIKFTDALSVIGRQAFEKTALTSVELPDSLIEIAYEAFYRSNLKEITIPDSVVILGESAFMANENMTSAVIGAGVDEISDGAFSNCSKLSTVDVRGTNVTVGNSAFANTAVSEINSENLGDIGSYAFAGTKIKDLNLTDGVTSIEYKAFDNCTDLSDIDMPESIQAVAGHAFDKTTWYNNQENGVTYLGTVLYDTKGKLALDTELLIKAGTTVLADVAFENEEGLKSITLPEGLTRIGVGTFFGCSNMTEINIPSTVTSVGKYAFRNCESLTTINVAAGNKMVYSEDNVLYGENGKELIYAASRADGKLVVPATVKTVRTGAIENSGINTLVIKGKNTVLEDNEELDFYRELNAFDEYDGVIIHCIKDSKADAFAKANNMRVVYIEDDTSCTEHSFGPWKDIVAATCTENGEQVRECTACGETETKVVEKTGHNHKAVVTAPTCTAEGYTTYTCVCGDSYVADKVAAKGHSYGAWIVDTAATCDKAGAQHKVCACGDKVTETIKALGHDKVQHKAKAATCTEKGWNAYETCSRCDYTTYKAIPAKGHKWEKTYTVDKTATTGRSGSKSLHCATCDAVKSGSAVTIAKIKKTTAETLVYNGKSRTQNVTVVNTRGKKLVKGTDFTVTYKNSKGTKVVTPKAVGTYKAVITFKGSYRGTVTKTFKINPKGTAISKLTKPAKKQIKVTWKKQAVQTTGYQIRYSTKQNMNGAKMVTVAKAKTTTRTIKQLKAKKKYWVQIRTYKTVNGVKHFSAWSAKKVITTK